MTKRQIDTLAGAFARKKIENFKWTIDRSWCKKPRFDLFVTLFIGEKNE
ncbi:hypothetical protein II898_00240 [bacterium]|nr:hypothetical protein [bacterium]